MSENAKIIKHLETKYDECNIHGICTISPALAAEKSALWALLQEWAFYITRVRALGAKNEKIKSDFIYIFSVFITNFEYSEENFTKIIAMVIKNVSEIKAFYKKLCEEQGINQLYYKMHVKLSPTFKMIDVIKQGQKFETYWKKNMSEEQRKTHEIIQIVLKSICLYILELQSVNYDMDKFYLELINALALTRLHNLPVEQMDEYLNKFVQIDHELLNEVFEMRKKEFGPLAETDVLMSAKQGKAILVSGANLKELELVLEATKGKGINVYTHGQLISAHAFEKLKSYPNLVGHYGRGAEFYMQDFSAFPGVIYLTNLFPFKVDSLYSSRIFTSAIIPPKNTTSLVEGNFEPLIKAAMSYDGFEETQKEKRLRLGLNENEYLKKLEETKSKVVNGEIKNIFVIGISNKVPVQEDYFKHFLPLVPKNTFLITYYYGKMCKNSLFANIDYAFPFLYKVVDELKPLKEKYGLKVCILFTRCEPHTIPNMIYINNLGFEKMYFHQCSPLLVNPAIVDFLLEKYAIKLYTNPENDLHEMLGE